jgi:hypothetical protein
VPPTGKDDNSLLGNLPQRRPGVESPRRAEARARRQAAARADSAPGEAAAESAADDTSGFEMLARAGVGLAAGAATAGLRIAARAAGGLGKAVGRR